MKEKGIKPNFSDLARRYGYDRKTVKKIWDNDGMPMLAVEGRVSHVLCISPGHLYGTGGAEARMASVGDDGEVTALGTLVDGVAKIDAST